MRKVKRERFATAAKRIALINGRGLATKMKTFRVSTENGDTYTVRATTQANAERQAKQEHTCRVTVYEETAADNAKAIDDIFAAWRKL